MCTIVNFISKLHGSMPFLLIMNNLCINLYHFAKGVLDFLSGAKSRVTTKFKSPGVVWIPKFKSENLNSSPFTGGGHV